jgi:thiamine kinase-like enzyme
MPPEEIAQTALRFVPGTGPVEIRRIGSGLVNESYRVARDGRTYALRVPAPGSSLLGQDRSWECRVLERAAAHGLAPFIERCVPNEGILVARWAPGRAWTSELARQPSNIEKMARLARRVHALPVPPEPRVVNPAGWIAFYREALARRGRAPPPRSGRSPVVDALADEHLAALEQPSREEAIARGGVLCHSDLHVQNLVEADHGLVLLDWEYAHVSEPLWDLAGWSCNNDFGGSLRAQLLAGYLGRDPPGQDPARLDRLVWLYDYVCVLWSELYLNAHGGAADEGILLRAQTVIRRLEHEPGGRAR